MKTLTLVIIIAVSIAVVYAGYTQFKSPGSATGAGGGASKLPGISEKALKDVLSGRIKYTADYSYTVEGQTSQITQAIDFPRFVMMMTANNMETRMIFDNEQIIVCNKATGSWQCFKMESDEPANVQVETEITEGKMTPKYIGTCSVAGENGLKYEFTSEDATSTMCYTSDGILLSMKTPTASMEATKVSRTFDESLMTPPATPQDLANMVAGAGQ